MGKNGDSEISGVQKAAILLIALGPEKSSQIFKHLKEEEIEELTLEIANTKSITTQTKDEVIKEFYEICLAQQYIAEGGIGYAKELLENALGTDKAMEVIGRLTASLQVKPFEFVRKADASQLLNFIQDEHPQTIALILSYLPAGQAAQIISALPPDRQADVAMRIATMDRTSPDVIKEVERVLETKLASLVNQEYNVIGGVMADIHPDLVGRIKKFIAYLPGMLKEYDEVFTGNVIAQQRMKGIGILSKEDAISYGVTGPSGRASGWSCDVRKLHPYGVYDRVEFKECIRTGCDTFDRYMVRMDEIRESLHILEQLIDNIPEGDYAVKTKPIIRVPEGAYWASVEASRGEFGVYLESRGDKMPYRVKFRSTGLPLVNVVDTLSRGNKIADLIAIGGSLDYVVPDIDR